MSELTASISLWLPVGRANFYSSTANNWLLKEGAVNANSTPARSKMLDEQRYRPRLQVSVLRRVLEVLPISFGYDSTGTCTLDDGDELKRPVAVTMRLHPNPNVAQLPPCPQRAANLPLVEAGIHEVTCHVDEYGAYAFTAKARFDADTDVRAALLAHVRSVFGGDYSLDRRSDRGTSDNAGGEAVRRYQGLDTGSSIAEEKPLGILTFFQLNTLAEGLFNESLSPAVFFEQNEDLDKFLNSQLPGALTLVRKMGEVIDLINVEDADATTPAGLIKALRRFLDATGREVLQRLKWSVESVRRSLLDESVGMLHRQSKLVQLDLGALKKEWMPELAEGASESQLRGYVMLAAAKLPLVANVYEYAMLARDHLNQVAEGRSHGQSSGPEHADHRALQRDVKRLEMDIRHWHTVLSGLRSNVQGLEQSIEHAWRENLLYEQRAVRSEQEAVAEITRSRGGRSGVERGNLNTYNIVTLLFTIAAVLIAIREGNFLDKSSVSSDWRTWVGLWPIGLLAIVFTTVVPLFNRWQQRSRDKRGYTESFPYEFAFRLEEAADPVKVFRYLGNQEVRRIAAPALAELTLTNQGGGRIERVSQHRALVKIHSIATFRVLPTGRRGRSEYARFEIVNEILAHKVSGRPTFMIIQCRLFGESPRALQPAEVLGLSHAVLSDVGDNLTGRDDQRHDSEGIVVSDILELIWPLLSVAPDSSGPLAAHVPAQGSGPTVGQSASRT